MEGTRYGLFRSGMDVAWNVVSMNISGEEHDMHSGGTLIMTVRSNISKRYLGIVFVFQ